ncbi:hypothetical protein EUZ85_18875 [Hahella sp. KA22]|uniref:hypothetical protein n=1 Tax=Hahella sp. KA22 TaxID=1628392 RepID=UPI000FDF3F57|nr:hypothetical protein [Hahella sp. KA22]AZZ92677.1 hypothetical protein ENC22_16300 [Hahella sp. KA22]QAY56050.1 hypothetical protein EUZ85_18875 [Hahella sp. KA22]
MELHKLGYDEKWLAYQILDPELFKQQCQAYEENGDSHTEHYRYAAFLHWIATRAAAPDEALNHFVELTLSDPDSMMGGSAFIQLLSASWLTDPQFDLLSRRAQELGNWTTDKVERVALMRRLRTGGLTPSLFRDCLQLEDSSLHEILLKRSDMDQDMMKALAEHGANKRIRNLAKQYSASKKRWGDAAQP